MHRHFLSLPSFQHKAARQPIIFSNRLGGRSSDQKVSGTDGCSKMTMDNGFEKITWLLGGVPTVRLISR
jgi:hypothetical protein